MTLEAELRVPDMIGEVIAWRAWQIVGPAQTPRLASVTALSTWSRREQGVEAIWPTNRWFYARCPGGHVTDIPVESCGCGLYAAKSMEQLIKLGYGSYRDVDADVKVVGQVGLTGKVIEGPEGWRAERGRVVRLWVPYEKWDLGERLGAAYNVPVEPAQWMRGRLVTLDELAERFAPPAEGGA
jgi:hypothetical protein